MTCRLVLVVPNFPKASETFIVSKFCGLVDAGFDVHILCDQGQLELWASFPLLANRPELRRRVHTVWPFRSRLKVIWTAPWLLASTGLRHPLVMLRYLARALTRFGRGALKRLYLDGPLIALNPDQIHFEFGAIAPERMSIKKLLGCRVSVSFRGYDLNFAGLDDPTFYGPVWRQADRVHMLGRDLYTRARHRGCPDELTVDMISPAIDSAFFQPSTTKAYKPITPEQPLQILSVGRLAWKKGYEFALEAVAQLRRLGVAFEYRIVGEGDMQAALGFARHQLGLDGQVTFLGSLTAAQIRDELVRTDLFLHAAVSEGFCNAVLEAQSMMVPVVTSDADGLGENIEPEVTGLLVPRRDPKAMARAIKRLADDPKGRREMGLAGRKRVRQHFDLAGHHQAWQRFFSTSANDSTKNR